MAAEATQKRPKKTGDTRTDLREAAAQAFNSKGFFGTDTNQIARDAGYSPQTFYRHYADKNDVFMAVYTAWTSQEERALGAAIAEFAHPDPQVWARRAAEILLDHHAQWAVFRRSLRWLTSADARIRAARNQSRARQARQLRSLSTRRNQAQSEAVAAILTLESLCDAYADGITADLDLHRAEWSTQITQILVRVLGR